MQQQHNKRHLYDTLSTFQINLEVGTFFLFLIIIIWTILRNSGHFIFEWNCATALSRLLKFMSLLYHTFWGDILKKVQSSYTNCKIKVEY